METLATEPYTAAICSSRSDSSHTSFVNVIFESEASSSGRYAPISARMVSARQTYRSVSRNGQPTGTTLVLKGRFTRVGRFRISIVGTLYDGASDQEVAFFRQTLWDVFDTTEAINLLSREVADFLDRIQYK